MAAQQKLLKEKAVTEDLVDAIDNTERQIKDMYFQDTNQVKYEIEEAKKEYVSEKRKYEDVMHLKSEIAQKIELFKQRFHEQRRQTKKNQEKQNKIEKDVNLVVEQCNYLEKENQDLKKVDENQQLIE